jgi:hypothetical protein
MGVKWWEILYTNYLFACQQASTEDALESRYDPASRTIVGYVGG